jgi:hypothetical protein
MNFVSFVRAKHSNSGLRVPNAAALNPGVRQLAELAELCEVSLNESGLTRRSFEKLSPPRQTHPETISF